MMQPSVSNLPIEQDFALILPPDPLFTWSQAALAMVLAVIGGAGLILVGRVVWRWWTAPPAPHVVALRRLDDVARQWPDRGPAWLIEQLSALTRDYLSGRYGSPAPYLSPRETVLHASQLAYVPPPLQRWLADLARQAEQVLYGGRSVSPDQIRCLVADTRRFIEQTRRELKDEMTAPKRVAAGNGATVAQSSV